MRFSMGGRLQYFRKLRGMTQKQLGTALGFPEQSTDVRIAQYESGARTPKEQTVLALAKVLEVAPTALAIPTLADETALMHLLFALEDSFGIVSIPFVDDDTELGKVMYWWRLLAGKKMAGEISKEEYDKWRYRFSFSG